MRVMLVGNPNCGKTTLFNALTGAQQSVGNWSGVTVEKKTGLFSLQNLDVHVTDLPGVYSLACSTEDSSLDARITAHEVLHGSQDIIINVVDACHLERHLYLTTQLLELHTPMILALNMMDLAQKRGISIDVQALSLELGCPVVVLEAHRSQGLDELKKLMQSSICPPTFQKLSLPHVLESALQHLERIWIERGHRKQHAQFVACRILEGDKLCMPDQSNQHFDLEMADARYTRVHHIVVKVQKKQSDAREHVTAVLDRWILHRFFGIPFFFLVMYAMFFLAIHVGGAFQDFFDITTDLLFVQEVEIMLHMLHLPTWLIALCAQGVGEGIHTTLTFIPVIAVMFFFLSFLEASGYMARAAFVMDKAMRVLGLPGKAFVPLIIGFGCNVPAILASRTLESRHDRFLSIVMSPFMSCSARLAIYAVFVAAFFPTGGENIIFSLYVLGLCMAVFTGMIVRKTYMYDTNSSFIVELPAYHRPTMARLIRDMWRRVRYFVVRAGYLIVPLSVVLAGLNAYSVGESVSLLARVGQWITPFFAPMGLQMDNWPATVSLLTGVMAKEVVIGSLNSLYAQAAHMTPVVVDHAHVWQTLKTAFLSVPQHLGLSFIAQPVLEKTQSMLLSPSVAQIMFQHFKSQASVYAYLVFILLYIPCVSTMAAIKQEANRRLMWFSIGWSLFVAYMLSVLFYQCATFFQHPYQSMAWVLFWVACLTGLIVWMHKTGHRRERLASC